MRIITKERPELEALIKTSKDRFNSLSRDEQESVLRAQRDGYVQAEKSWPKGEERD